MHDIIILLVDKSAYIPVELHPVRGVLPALYEGLWACDVEQCDGWGETSSAANSLAVLDGCKASLRVLYDTIRRSCSDLPSPHDVSEGTDCNVLDNLATANDLIRRIHAALLSLPRRRKDPNAPRSSKKNGQPRKVVASSQAWKYSCSGAGSQHNTVQEGSGYQIITDNRRVRGDVDAHSLGKIWHSNR